MSVAFRRESDEEHLEPKFERPIPAAPNRVTRAGARLIEDRIAAIEAALPSASGTDEEELRRDLRYWLTRRATAIVTAAPADGSIGFGSCVTMTMAGRERAVSIVGDDEADPNAGRLAYGAPLAQALIGGEAGDILPFNGRADAIEILAVTPIDAAE